MFLAILDGPAGQAAGSTLPAAEVPFEPMLLEQMPSCCVPEEAAAESDLAVEATFARLLRQALPSPAAGKGQAEPLARGRLRERDDFDSCESGAAAATAAFAAIAPALNPEAFWSSASETSPAVAGAGGTAINEPASFYAGGPDAGSEGAVPPAPPEVAAADGGLPAPAVVVEEDAAPEPKAAAPFESPSETQPVPGPHGRKPTPQSGAAPDMQPLTPQPDGPAAPTPPEAAGWASQPAEAPISFAVNLPEPAPETFAQRDAAPVSPAVQRDETSVSGAPRAGGAPRGAAARPASRLPDTSSGAPQRPAELAFVARVGLRGEAQAAAGPASLECSAGETAQGRVAQVGNGDAQTGADAPRDRSAVKSPQAAAAQNRPESTSQQGAFAGAPEREGGGGERGSSRVHEVAAPVAQETRPASQRRSPDAAFLSSPPQQTAAAGQGASSGRPVPVAQETSLSPQGSPERHEPQRVAEPTQATWVGKRLSEEPASTPPLRQLRFQVSSQGRAAGVEIRVRENGDMKVAVRASNSELAESLRQRVPEMVEQLEHRGYEADVWRPLGARAAAGIVAGERRDAAVEAREAAAGSGGAFADEDGAGRGRQQGRHERQPQWFDQWQEDLPAAGGRKEKRSDTWLRL